MKNQRANSSIRYIVGIGLFTAMAYIVTFVLRIPVMFLSFEAKDAVVCIAAFLYGPFSGVIISLLSSLIELLTISDTGVYGFLMNFISSSVFAFTASIIYKYNKKFSGAIIGTYSATVTMTIAMIIANIFITPHYMGVAQTQVVEMIPTLFLPFNVAKGLLNTAITLILYKPIVIALTKAHLIQNHESTAKFSKKSIVSLVIATVTMGIAIAIFVFLKH